MRNRLAHLLLLSTLFLIPSLVHAGPCAYFKRNLPTAYKLYCKSGGEAASRPAGASSTFTSAFNINSASLPTDPSDYGLETIVSVIQNPLPEATKTWTPDFALVKGFRKIGTGISTSAAYTFYSNDVIQRMFGEPEVQDFRPLEPAQGAAIHLNVGTSFAIYSPERGPKFSLGGTFRYNRITDRFGGGPALLMSGERISIGAGFTREKVSNALPMLTFLNGMASFRVWLFEFEYTFLKENARQGLSPIHIGTLTATMSRVILTGAARRLNYLQSGSHEMQYHAAIQFLVSPALSLGVLHHYIPGANSVAAQFFF